MFGEGAVQIKVPSACNELGEFAIIQLRRRKLKADITSVRPSQRRNAKVTAWQTDTQVCMQTYRLTMPTCLLISNYASFRVTE